MRRLWCGTKFHDLQVDPAATPPTARLVLNYKRALRRVQDNAIKQNITTLHNRVNELGVAEPAIQQWADHRRSVRRA